MPFIDQGLNSIPVGDPIECRQCFERGRGVGNGLTYCYTNVLHAKIKAQNGAGFKGKCFIWHYKLDRILSYTLEEIRENQAESRLL